MKKILAVISIALATFVAIYASTIGISLSYSHNMEYPQKIIEEIKYINQDFSIRVIEHSGRELRLDTQYIVSTNKFLHHRFLFNSSFTYETVGGWSGLGYMAQLLLQGEILYLGISAGAQISLAYSAYFSKLLFTASPIIEVVGGMDFDKFEFFAYMSLVSPFERDWKTTPTLGAKALVYIASSHWLGAEAFIKFAEYLTDTRTLVEAFGLRLTCEVRLENANNAQDNTRAQRGAYL